MEDVKTTRFTDGALAHDPRRLSVPLTAGSSNSAWNMGRCRVDLKWEPTLEGQTS